MPASMSVLGRLHVLDFLERTGGQVRGRLITDAKDRYYSRDYRWKTSGSRVTIQRADGYGNQVTLPSIVDLREELVAFFGLYSGDGAKGVEAPDDQRRIIPTISFSQREPHLVRFAVDQFRALFSDDIRFAFALGEDSAFFMDGEGLASLRAYYKAEGQAEVPATPPLAGVRPALSAADEAYLREVRPDVTGENTQALAFYYAHKQAMETILSEVKRRDLESAGVALGEKDRVMASLRRPFKKGARLPGGSSRSDEVAVGGLNGLGELFLKMLHEVEESILRDTQVSISGLVQWNAAPSEVGTVVDVTEFFSRHPYGQLAGGRPLKLEQEGAYLEGQWPRSSMVRLHPTIRMSPLWCYTSGLYLAEGSTPKSALFKMFSRRATGFALSFTSSEGASIELVLRSLQTLFAPDQCVDAWKIKVGSQYFPELVVTGLKHGVPMLRGGRSGDGKLRTMEISLALRDWALAVADAPLDSASLLRQHYEARFTHVEPTGAGVARIDLSASSALCRWYFPLLMFSVFGNIVADPTKEFY